MRAKQPDGSFGLTADLWNGHVENEIGQGYGKLLQLYGVKSPSACTWEDGKA